MEFSLTFWDYVIVIVYFLGVLLHGYFAGRGKDTSEGYFLAGRNLPWVLIGFSLYSSNMSGSSFVGLMGATYDNGIVVFNYEWTATVILIFFAFFMLPYFLRSEVATIPEFLESRYDKRSRNIYSAFTVLAIIFIDTAGALYAGGIVITKIMPLELWQAVAILGTIAGIYTILGGLSAVVVTDTVQAILLILGSLAIFWIGLEEVGGWNELMSHFETDDRKTHLIQPSNDEFLPWPGIFGVLILGFYYWTLNQFIVQRTLGAKNLDQGRKGALFAGLLKLPNLVIMIIPGLIGLVLYPELDNADAVFPTLAFDLLPIGIRGLVLTALIAAIMSSLDSALNAGSTLITLDFIKENKSSLSDKKLVYIGKITTAALMIIGIVYAPMIKSFETLFEYFQSSLSYVVPAIVATYLAGIFSKRVTNNAAFYVILSGLVLGIALFITKEVTPIWTNAGLPEIHYTYMGSIMFLAALGALFLVSMSGQSNLTDDEVEKLVFTGKDFRNTILKTEDFTWYKDFRVLSAAVLLATAAVVIYFA